MESAIAYYRVSTRRQQRSGLGLEAQRAAVTRLAEGMKIIGEYVEVETGKASTPLRHGADRCRLCGDSLEDRRRVRPWH